MDTAQRKPMKNKLFFPLDLCIVIASYLLVAYLTQDDFSVFSPSLLHSITIALVCYGLLFVGFRVYKTLWLYSSLRDCFNLGMVAVGACAVTCLVSTIVSDWQFNVVKGRFHILAFLMIVLGMFCGRMLIRLVIIHLIRGGNKDKGGKRLLIIGAGSAGMLLLRDIRSNPNLHYCIVGLIDDDTSKINCRVLGSRVLGNRNDIIRICEEERVNEIFLAIPSMKESERRKVLAICSETDCKIKLLPDFTARMREYGDEIYNKVRDVQVEDLLAREPIELDNRELSEYIADRVVLVTGGGGSIGSELCRQVAKFSPSKLVILDIYENNAYDLENELKQLYPGLALEVVIASVRDLDRIDDVFARYRPHTVFHAAAHKHVPLMESSPGEAIKNNVFGTLNVATCADKHHVERFVMISTDKAVNPTNVMGATKRICEMIVQSLNAVSDTNFVAVRFGNVLGSNGSVIPLFQKQIASGGPVTVTHKEITRFFMTIPEAAQLVLQAVSYAKGGEIFILDMGEPVKIYDLAVNLIKLSGYRPNVDIKIEFTGLRPGEKLYEELLMNEEGLQKTRHEKIFIGQPFFCDMEQIKEYLDLLEDALKSNDNEEIKNAVAKIVPTYVRKNENELELVI